MPTIADPYYVLTVLTSLLIITLVPDGGTSMAAYKQIAAKIGMNADKKRPAAEGKLMRRLNVIAEELGPLPHDALDIRATM